MHLKDPRVAGIRKDAPDKAFQFPRLVEALLNYPWRRVDCYEILVEVHLFRSQNDLGGEIHEPGQIQVLEQQVKNAHASGSPCVSKLPASRGENTLERQASHPLLLIAKSPNLRSNRTSVG